MPLSAARIGLATARRIWRHPHNRHRRGRRLAAWLAWQAWERTVRRPWTVTLDGGATLELVPHDPVTAEVLYCGLPDWAEMSFIRRYLRPGDRFVDVGANVGLYTLVAAGVEGVGVVAFEPDPATRARAAANVARNRLAERVELRAEAVGAAPGHSLLTTGHGPMNRLVAGPTPATTATTDVTVTTLDAALDGGAALVKVDVEGAEAAVLDGAARLLAGHRPALVLEANDPGALTARLGPLGYRWVRYDPASHLLTPTGPPPPGTNGIAVADLPRAAARLGRPGSARS